MWFPQRKKCFLRRRLISTTGCYLPTQEVQLSHRKMVFPQRKMWFPAGSCNSPIRRRVLPRKVWFSHRKKVLQWDSSFTPQEIEFMHKEYGIYTGRLDLLIGSYDSWTERKVLSHKSVISLKEDGSANRKAHFHCRMLCSYLHRKYGFQPWRCDSPTRRQVLSQESMIFPQEEVFASRKVHFHHRKLCS